MNRKTHLLDESLRDAILNHEPEQVGQIIDYLRFTNRMDYQACYHLAHELTGITAADWDALLYEADQCA